MTYYHATLAGPDGPIRVSVELLPVEEKGYMFLEIGVESQTGIRGVLATYRLQYRNLLALLADVVEIGDVSRELERIETADAAHADPSHEPRRS